MLKYIIIIIFSLSIISCGGKNTNINLSTDGKSEGWINENTFIISAEGIPSKTLINPESIKKSAISSAKRHAQNKILFRFKKESKVSGGKDNKQLKKIISLIKNGKILKVNYDATGRCFILYEITSKGLKNDVNNTNLEGTDIIN